MTIPARHVFFFCLAAACCSGSQVSVAQNGRAEDPRATDEADAGDGPIGRFVVLGRTVDQPMLGKIRTVALRLQQDATQGDEQRKAFLVLKLQDGSSQFGLVRDLAEFLTDPAIGDVTTVAWVPETVTGNNAIVALACEEIVMHPDTQLGDIGNGRAASDADQKYVLSLAERRHNRMLSEALVRGMLDPSAVVKKVRVTRQEGGEGRTEVAILTPEEIDELSADDSVGIEILGTLKERGERGLISGAKAKVENVLVVQTALNEGEVAGLYGIPQAGLDDDPGEGGVSDVKLIRIHEPITDVLSSFLLRQIERATGSGSQMIIFDIDSPQGKLQPSLDLANAIAELRAGGKVTTVAFVSGEALGGAAIVPFAADELYMADGARIGDISSGVFANLDPDAQEVPEDELGELEVIRQRLVELCEETGRPAAVPLAMLDPTLEIRQATNLRDGRLGIKTADELANDGEWKPGPVVPESTGEGAMILDAAAAERLRIAPPPVADLDALRTTLGIPDDVQLRPIGRTWVDTLIFWLNSDLAMFLLIVAGVVFVYLELHMVSGLFGILAAICFATFFWSRFLGGTAGWLEVLLFGIGLICIGIEFFVFPGLGAFGIMGGLLVFGSIVMASQTFGNFEPGSDRTQFAHSLATLAGSIVTVVAMAMFLSKFLPRMPILNQIILTPPSMGHDPDSPLLRTETESPLAGLIGQRGTTVSVLRPAGRIRIGGEMYDVLSNGPYIEQGADVEIVAIEGNRVIVKEV